MTVTKIKRQKNGRFAIYANEQYLLSVDEKTLIDSRLEKGAEISKEEAKALLAQADEQYACDRAMTILSFRDHSKEELRRKLSRTVGEENAEKASQHMADIGLVNDDEYAEKLARELLSRRLFGAQRALYEMTRRGLDRELCREVIERLDTDTSERILLFLKKKYPEGLDDEKIRRRATAALARSGYRWDDIKEALRDYEEDF